jgi:hypothetical protein
MAQRNSGLHKIKLTDEQLIKLQKDFVVIEQQINKNKDNSLHQVFDTNENNNHIIHLSKELLQQHKYAIGERSMVEYWRYTVDKKEVSSDLGWHCDDYGAINYKVSTCIYYIQKDTAITGGGLWVEHFGTTTLIPVETGDLIIMPGNLLHKPENMQGVGQRKCIVVQIEHL